jgi:hypothetical protein
VLIVLATSRSVFGVLLAASCAVVLAACGSARSTGYHNPHYPYGAPNVPISESKCMRANGVPNFPDPIQGPGGVGLPQVSSSPGTLTVEGVALAGPAFEAAQKACKEYTTPGGPPPAVSESEKQAAIANAECMRKHGVPNFPDPTFSGGQLSAGLGGVDPQSPAFKRAAAACGGAGGAAQRFSAGP